MIPSSLTCLSALVFLAACGPDGEEPRSGASVETGEGPAPTDQAPAPDGPERVGDPGQVPGFESAEPNRHPDDPDDWVSLTEFEGAPVETLRDMFPTGGLRLIACYHAGHLGEPDQRHGPEWSYFKNGFKKETLFFVDGVAHGPFQRAWQNGQVRHQGEFVRGERHGVFKQWYGTGDQQLEYHYDHGRPTGVWYEWYVSGDSRLEETYVDGLLHGLRRSWYQLPVEETRGEVKPSVLSLEQTYVRGVLHGPWRDYDPEQDTLRTTGQYEDGKRVGAWVTRYPTGQIIDEFSYVDGELHGPQTRWTTEGDLLEQLTWDHGLKTGPARQFFAGGGLQAEGNFLDGMRQGPWIYYTPDGARNATWSGVYENDQRVEDLPD
jgi:antitoxin component YwqK of YwqJK toxin-antitoxin module